MSWACLRYLRSHGVAGYRPIPIEEIDEDIMVTGVLKHLPPRFLLRTMSLVSKRIKKLCDNEGMWHVKLAESPWLVDSEVTAAWSRGLGAKNAFRLLCQVGWLQGIWVLDDKPRGGILRFSLKSDGIFATLLKPYLDDKHPMEVQKISQYQGSTPFSFRVESSGRLMVQEVGQDFAGEEMPAKDFFGFSGARGQEARVSFYTRATRIPQFYKLVLRSSAADTGNRALDARGCDLKTLSFMGSGAPTDTHVYDKRFARPPRVTPRVFSNEKLLPDWMADTTAFDPAELQGLWRGMCGPHGSEILCLSVCTIISQSFTELVGLKCTGDPNVPSGELAFRAPLTCDYVRNPSQSPKKNLCTGLHAPYTCSCTFKCDCPETPVVARCIYDGLSLVAEHGFVRPTWNSGVLVVLDDGTGDVLLVWKGLFSVRFMRLLDEDFDVVAESSTTEGTMVDADEVMSEQSLISEVAVMYRHLSDSKMDVD